MLLIRLSIHIFFVNLIYKTLFIRMLFYLIIKTNNMKFSKEFTNGFIIFVGIGTFYFLIKIAGLSDLYYLRFISVFFVFYGVNRTIKMNLSQGKKSLASDAGSALLTSLIGVFLSIFGIVIYAYLNGGDSFVHNLPKTFSLGGEPTLICYTVSLLIEGISSSVVVTMLLLIYWNNRHTID